ncbi:MAG TPA: hypothetical protein VFK45_11585 [Gammaproteobacteria bacterium]|nr:hypothetical protein [Gammaproteobacteria bacterium]
MPGAAEVRLDLNNPEFQSQLFNLQKHEQRAVLNGLRKLARMTWPQVYRDKGLKWEQIHSRTGPQGRTLYSLRLGKAFRVVAWREEEWLRLLTLHPDHDSAYH